ncbi:SIS domain-containing protein [Microvirga sp. G4-2]|uniref:SIS domain-containing protein n=1 Tax=Microvirga sp. G4-2 TaxID=3434467 RepID=UPI004043BFDF
MNFRESIDLQPERLASSRLAVADVLREIDTTPLKNGSVGFVGIGASLYASIAGASEFRSRGLSAHAFSPMDLLEQPSGLADSFIALSASGRSVETVDAMRSAKGSLYAISKDSENPLASVVQGVITTRSGLEASPSAPSFTTTLQAIGMLADRLTGQFTAAWERLPEAAIRILVSSPKALERCANAFGNATSIDFIGERQLLGTAYEGALLAREAARLPACGFDLRNFLHGPMEALDERMALVVHGSHREVKLAQDAAAFGCPTLLVSDRNDVPDTTNLIVLRVPSVGNSLADSILQLIAVQLLVARLSAARGLADSKFRYRQADTKIA